MRCRSFCGAIFHPSCPMWPQRYSAGPTLVGLVIESFSIGTVLAAGIAGRLIDSRGYRAAILLGLAALVVFSTLRAIEGPFWLIVLAQAGIGATLPFITGATSSFVVDWFEPSQESRVTGVCMVGVFAGLAASMVYSPWAFSSWGFNGLMRSAAALSLALLLLAYPLMRERTLRRPPRTARKGSRSPMDPEQPQSLGTARNAAFSRKAASARSLRVSNSCGTVMV